MRDTIVMARDADLIDDSYASDWYVYQLKHFEALVRADERSIEREACAKVCDSWALRDSLAADIAKEIRARSEAT
jgi:hypothetical protein